MKDLKQKTDTELQTMLTEKREALRVLRFNASGSGMRDVKALRNTKKEIAQTLTEINSRAAHA